MSTKCRVVRPNEIDNQILPDRERRHQRLAALGSLPRDRVERIDAQRAEYNYWDRAAPTVFSLFMASLIILLVLSYTGLLIV